MEEEQHVRYRGASRAQNTRLRRTQTGRGMAFREEPFWSSRNSLLGFLTPEGHGSNRRSLWRFWGGGGYRKETVERLTGVVEETHIPAPSPGMQLRRLTGCGANTNRPLPKQPPSGWNCSST